nr:Immunoglobulin [Hymenolepis microstoma]
MSLKKEFTLTEGLSLNLTCRFRKGPKNPITWQKDGIYLNLQDDRQSAKIIETNVLSLLMLTNLTQSDAGNYSCRSMRKSGPQSQWVYIHVKDKYGDLNGSQTVADEPHSKNQSNNRKSTCTDPPSCNIKQTSASVNKPPLSENSHLKEIANNGLPIVGSTEPYAFLLGSTEEIESNDDFSNNIQLIESCEDSPEGCTDGLGGSTAVIGIGTMCCLFFIAVIVSAFFIRRKILRRQRRVFRVQNTDHNCFPQTNSAERLPMDNLSPDHTKVPIISTVSRNPAAFQEVIYLDRTPNAGEFVYIPHSTVYEQHCASSSQPFFLPLVNSSHIPFVS